MQRGFVLFIAAKFVPIHCIVEQTASPSGGKHGTETNVELDTYAILPSSALFSDIVRIALLKIGYSSSEAMGAKGTLCYVHLQGTVLARMVLIKGSSTTRIFSLISDSFQNKTYRL